MTPAVPQFRPPVAPETPAIVRVVSREDVLWNRPVFKAPPLNIDRPLIDPRRVAEELRRIGLVAH